MRTCLIVVSSIVVLVAACGSDGSKFDDPGPAPPTFGDAGFGPAEGGGPPDANLYEDDPPPKWCGPGGDPAPPPPGGTEACPDDKNKPGCPCNTAGEKAACWTGLRKHRNLGICKDGQTTCVRKNETSLQWGPCEGEVLPLPGVTKGKEACGCFSAGQWKVANLSPCIMQFGSDNYNAVSTIVEAGKVKCPEQNPPVGPPAQDWSTDTLKVDCAGHFRLCLRLRQGVFETPSPNDCVLVEVCTESDYKTPDVEQVWPNVPGWISKDKACAKKWAEVPRTESAGYVEMVVKGQSVRCDAIDDGKGGDLVFNRVKYCPLSCKDTPNSPECKACQLSGQGEF